MRKCRKYMSKKLHMLMVGTMAFSLSSANIVHATTISLEENVSEQNQVVIIADDTQKEETLSLEETKEVREEQSNNDEVEVITPASIEVKKSRMVEPEMKTTEPVQELDIASGDITITSSGTYKIISSVSNAFTTNVISVGENFEGTVILDNIEIEPRMEIAPTAKVTLKLVGKNAIIEGIHFGNATTGSLLITADETEVEKIKVDGLDDFIVKKKVVCYMQVLRLMGLLELVEM